MNRTLCQVLNHQVNHQPDAVAFFDTDRAVTFSEFSDAVAQIAADLAALKFPAETRIAYLAEDGVFGYALLFACARLGLVLMPLNWRLSVEELGTILEHGQPPLLFTDARSRARLQRALAKIANLRTVVIAANTLNSGLESAPSPCPSRRDGDGDGDGDQACVQLTTSGTTGRPKGVVLAERSFFALINHMHDQGDAWMNLQNHDRLLLALPIFHIGGMWWAIQGFVAGAAGVLQPRFSSLAALEAIQRHAVSQIAMVPSMLQMVLTEPACDHADFSSVKGLLYGGSPIHPALLKQAQEHFNCRPFQIYGLTETGNMAVCLRPEDHESDHPRRDHAAGRACPGVQLKIVDKTGRNAASGAVGEVWIHSPAAMLGYHRDPQATEETLIDGWVRTGDAGFLDENGYLTLCDRIKDMIIYAGENIFPAEIEAVLTKHGAVAEAAVIGVPDPRWGESVKAFVVPHKDVDLRKRDLLAFAKNHLADFKVPKSLHFVETLPRNASGKLLKRELRAPYWANQQRQVN